MEIEGEIIVVDLYGVRESGNEVGNDEIAVPIGAAGGPALDVDVHPGQARNANESEAGVNPLRLEDAVTHQADRALIIEIAAELGTVITREGERIPALAPICAFRIELQTVKRREIGGQRGRPGPDRDVAFPPSRTKHVCSSHSSP